MSYCKCKKPNIVSSCGEEGTCCYTCSICHKPVLDDVAFGKKRKKEISMKLTKKEKDFLINLVLAQQDSISFLRGFGKRNSAELKEIEYYGNLINKIEKI